MTIPRLMLERLAALGVTLHVTEEARLELTGPTIRIGEAVAVVEPYRDALIAYLMRSAAVYGPDAAERRHALPGADRPLDRPHVRPDQLCGGCARWVPHRVGSESGHCLLGFQNHRLPVSAGMDHPETSRGSRCWADRGAAWRRRLPDLE
ncbi:MULTISPECIES: hypothetical protein [Deinococcus]|uniref:TubC N-terminal docking domain-containing protein n=1 Tax=Deinococcus rufus TaxID=2136097 RepID=A0ABV7ZB67_9DEIO|nr:hypothetical protein [Deinococcus sp. AB2017081]WQE94674.1 hypothetical protein U2P90_14860 [Deinococcus sp. AB2017081]